MICSIGAWEKKFQSQNLINLPYLRYITKINKKKKKERKYNIKIQDKTFF